MKYLALYLCAPLQSWGARAKFNERTTLPYPTRSGVVGLLSAACGVDRSDREWLKCFESIRMKVLMMAPRSENPFPSRSIVDYQTVGGGYTEKGDTWHSRCRVAKFDGDTKTEVTHHEYLADARCGAILKIGDSSFAERLAAGARNPIWGVWLGRKCCIPTEPVFAGLYDAEELAVKEIERRARSSVSEAIIETRPGDAEAEDVLPDVPLDFKQRRYAVRTIKRE